MDSLFEKAFDSLDTPHMCIDRNFRFVAVNQAYERVVGRVRSDLIGQGLFDIFPESGVGGQRLLESLNEVLVTGESSRIAFLRYEIASASGEGLEERFWTANHTPIRDLDGRVTHIVQNTMDVTELAHREKTAALPFRNVPVELALLRHAQDVEEAYRESASESAEFRRLFRQSPGLIAVLEGESLICTFVNDTFQSFLDDRPVLGRPLDEAIPEFEGQAILPLLRQAMEEKRQLSGENLKLRIADARGEARDAFIDFTFSPVRIEDGQVAGIFLQAADRTEFMRAVERQRHLLDELNHRVKNTLATVQSMARQSFRNVEDAADAREAFESRIMALSQAHNVLSARRWEAASLHEVLEHELSMFDPARLAVKGPQVETSAPAAIALAMVFHELARNAVQHGAMAHDGGTLEIVWSEEKEREGRCLALVWRERTPGLRAPPIVDGFGMRMIRRVVTGELGGRFEVVPHEDGMECRIEIELLEVEERGISAA